MRGCFVIGIVLHPRPAPAQEALQNSIAEEASAAARSSTPEGQPYTFKSGDFRLVVAPSLSASWNDNVNLSDSNREDDFIIQPTVGLNATYPLSDRNLLNLSLSAGYTFYCNHRDLDSLYLASGSQLSLDVFVKDFQFNFHDSFSYTQNSSTQPAVFLIPAATARFRIRPEFREPGIMGTLRQR